MYSFPFFSYFYSLSTFLSSSGSFTCLVFLVPLLRLTTLYGSFSFRSLASPFLPVLLQLAFGSSYCCFFLSVLFLLSVLFSLFSVPSLSLPSSTTHIPLIFGSSHLVFGHFLPFFRFLCLFRFHSAAFWFLVSVSQSEGEERCF